MAAKLEAIGAPAVDCSWPHLAFMPALRTRRHRPTLKQQAILAHNAMDPLNVHRSRALIRPLVSKLAPDAAVTPAWQVRNDAPDFFDQPSIIGLPGCSPIAPISRRARFAVTFERATPRTSQTCFTGRLYERLPFEHVFLRIETGWVAALYPAFLQPILPTAGPDEIR
jgi:hypothetical protein